MQTASKMRLEQNFSDLINLKRKKASCKQKWQYG